MCRRLLQSRFNEILRSATTSLDPLSLRVRLYHASRGAVILIRQMADLRTPLSAIAIV